MYETQWDIIIWSKTGDLPIVGRQFGKVAKSQRSAARWLLPVLLGFGDVANKMLQTQPKIKLDIYRLDFPEFVSKLAIPQYVSKTLEERVWPKEPDCLICLGLDLVAVAVIQMWYLNAGPEKGPHKHPAAVYIIPPRRRV